MREHKSKTYDYKGYELICGAQPMEDGSNFSASLMTLRQGASARSEKVVPLEATPFTEPDTAIAYALLQGRHWVDNLAG